MKLHKHCSQLVMLCMYFTCVLVVYPDVVPWADSVGVEYLGDLADKALHVVLFPADGQEVHV